MLRTQLYGHKVVQVDRADRRLRPLQGKSDTLNAVNDARAVLSRNATAIPKSADGTVEMLRHQKIACETASKNRSVTMVTLKSLLVNAPERLQLEETTMSQLKLARLLATLRPRSLDTPQDSLPARCVRWQLDGCASTRKPPCLRG